MLDGETLASVARQFGVSRPLVSRLVNGRRAGVRGKSAQVYHHLLAIVRRRAA